MKAWPHLKALQRIVDRQRLDPRQFSRVIGLRSGIGVAAFWADSDPSEPNNQSRQPATRAGNHRFTVISPTNELELLQPTANGRGLLASLQ